MSSAPASERDHRNSASISVGLANHIQKKQQCSGKKPCDGGLKVRAKRDGLCLREDRRNVSEMVKTNSNK